METEHWSILAEIVRGWPAVGLVALMLVRFDRGAFHLTDVGMAWKPNPRLMILSGLLAMSVLFLGAGGEAAVRGVQNGVPGLSVALAQVGASGLIVIAISTLANAFWQEVVFRGDLQPRLPRSYGIRSGILMCASVFVVLHRLVRPCGRGRGDHRDDPVLLRRVALLREQLHRAGDGLSRLRELLPPPVWRG